MLVKAIACSKAKQHCAFDLLDENLVKLEEATHCPCKDRHEPPKDKHGCGENGKLGTEKKPVYAVDTIHHIFQYVDDGNNNTLKRAKNRGWEAVCQFEELLCK